MGETLDTIGSGVALVAACGTILGGAALGVKYFSDHYEGIDAAYVKAIYDLDDMLPGGGIFGDQLSDCQVDRFFDPHEDDPGFREKHPCPEDAGRVAIREGR